MNILPIINKIKNELKNTTHGNWNICKNQLIDEKNNKISKHDDLIFCSNCHDVYIPLLLEYIADLEYELINSNTYMDGLDI